MEWRRLLVAVDGSQQATKALEWSAATLLRPADVLHVLYVIPPINYSVYPVGVFGTASAMAAVSAQWELEKTVAEQHAEDALQRACTLLDNMGVPRHQVHTRIVPAVGGASGIAESIAMYARYSNTDMLIVGSRGMGAVKRSLLSLVGLGSVSNFCVHNIAPCICPVLVVRDNDQQEPPAPPPPPPPPPQQQQQQQQVQPGSSKDQVEQIMEDAAPTPPTRQTLKVCVAMDSSPAAATCLRWAVRNLLGPADELHIVSVVEPAPCLVLDDIGGAGAAAMSTQLWGQARDASHAQAMNICRSTSRLAVGEGVDAGHIVARVLEPDGGPSDIACSVCRYAQQQGIDVVALGCRGLGAWRRLLMNLAGLGSVSDYCVNNLSCVAAVVHATCERLTATGSGGGAEHAAAAVHGAGSVSGVSHETEARIRL